jgi:hypothetical protein
MECKVTSAIEANAREHSQALCFGYQGFAVEKQLFEEGFLV